MQYVDITTEGSSNPRFSVWQRAFGGDVLAEDAEDDNSPSNQKTASSSLRMWRH